MSAKVVSWADWASQARGWTNEELAELYRVEHSLVQAGLTVETDSGVSDEGDPWFVFCHADGHVVVHIARFDGLYHLDCAANPYPLKGRTFEAISKRFVASIGKAQYTEVSGRIVAHPSALLSLIVAAAMLSVDALLHDSARADALPPDMRSHPLLPNLAPTENAKIAKEFAHNLSNAVWRSSEGGRSSEQLKTREAVWQAVEIAAVGLGSISETLAGIPDSSHAESGILPALDVPSLPDVQTIRAPESLGSSMLGMVDRGGELSGGINSVTAEQAHATGPPSLLWPAIDSPGFAAQRITVPDAETSWILKGVSLRLPGDFHSLSASPQAETPIGASELLGTQTHFDINLKPGGGALDLGAYAIDSINIMVSGSGPFAFTHADSIQLIEVASGAKPELTLSYSGSHFTGSINQSLNLDGGTDVSVALRLTPDAAPATSTEPTTSAAPTTTSSEASAAAPPLNLVIDSGGPQPNTVNLAVGDNAGGLPADLSIKVIGTQDLALNESGSSAISSSLDASQLTGHLTLGIDLGSGGAAVTSLRFGSANFVVTPQDSIAIENLSGRPQVDLGIDLHTAVLGFANGATADGSTALSVDLGAIGSQWMSVDVGVIEPIGVNDLTINSSSGSNAIQVVDDSALTNLNLGGATPLEIDSIQGIAPQNTSGIVIDAEALTGSLTLNATTISDTSAGGRAVSFVTGGGSSTITDTNTTESLYFNIGSGQVALNIGSGTDNVILSGLKGVDRVNIGAANFVDLFTNGVNALLSHQTVVDAAANVMDAASAAASFVGLDGPHQALLFSYRGANYVFVDTIGTHLFNPSADEIIKLMGVTPSTDLSGVFHSG